MLIERRKTYSVTVSDKKVATAIAAISLQTLNIYNGVLYILRNVQSSFTDKKVHEKLHQNQIAALKTAQDTIDKVNNLRLNKDANARLIAPLLETGNVFCLLDKTVIDNLGCITK